ncbi:RHS repeat-associated core domain-containing protein [Thermoflexibacter ruber]|uniref:RHS repeat-associated core domain-containing protein n=1 Tax=Thermoflexibacter ruber TaxID=1003 RepID=A0A1I2JFM3_9BACT|nr:RHS repeat-associated core domain-containing protein [Thermoflexibacter ruber]SFF51967.1 RHS repeat-associated core domain-containing protein [Thermoflexibacter ruber]
MKGLDYTAPSPNQENKFTFNGQTEKETKLNLHWHETAFRGYDPQLGRFHQIDPLAEASSNLTSFHFASNNPIASNDPMGLCDGCNTWEDVYNTALKDPSKLKAGTYVNSGDGGFAHFDSDTKILEPTVVEAKNDGSFNHAEGNTNKNWLNDRIYAGESSKNSNVLQATLLDGKPMSMYEKVAVPHGLASTLVGMAEAWARYDIQEYTKTLESKNTKTAMKKLKRLPKTHSLGNLGGVAKFLGVFGFAMNAAKVIEKLAKGEAMTNADAFDLVVTGGLAIATFSNPVVIGAIGLYGLGDAVGLWNPIKTALGGDNELYKLDKETLQLLRE